MKTHHASFRHVALFFLIGLGCAGTLSRGEDGIVASTQHVPLTTGTYQTLEAAVVKSDAIFVGKVTDQGAEAPLPQDAPFYGPLYRGVGVRVLHSLLGLTSDDVLVSVYVASATHNGLPRMQRPQIIFLQTHRQSWPLYPFNQLGKDDASSIAIKVIPATEANIAEVKRLIAAAKS